MNPERQKGSDVEVTAKDKIREISVNTGGFITTHDMSKNNIAYGSVRHLVQSGVLTKITRGIYRFNNMPHVANEDYYMIAAFFKKNEGGYSAIIGGISALDILEVTDLMPSGIQLIVEPNFKTKRELPLQFEIIESDSSISEDRVYYHNGLPLQRAGDAIITCLKLHLGQKSLLRKTFEKALDLGLIRASEEEKIREHFKE